MTIRHTLFFNTILISLGFLFQSFNLNKNPGYILNYNILKENKQKINNNNSELIKAKSNLLKEADIILYNTKKYTITTKKELPPSKLKNDFYSLAPYWWPDNSHNDDVPYIRKDGKVNPESKEVKDAQLLKEVSTDLYILGLAYYYSNNESYVHKANKIIDEFFLNEETKMNPNLKYAQVIKGKNSRGSTTIVSASFIKLLEGVELLNQSGSLKKDSVVKLKSWFHDFINWFENDPIAIAESKGTNNIAVYFTAQIVSYYKFIGKDLKAKTILEEKGKVLIDQQISSDGSLLAELKRATPWEYVKYTLSGFDYLVELSDKLGVNLYNYKSPNGGSIKKMYEWIIPYTNNKKWNYSRESLTANQANMVLLRSKMKNFVKKAPVRKAGLTYLNVLTNRIY